MAYLNFRVEDLESVKIVVEVSSLQYRLSDNLERDFLAVSVLYLATETDLFKTQDNVSHVLDNAGER